MCTSGVDVSVGDSGSQSVRCGLSDLRFGKLLATDRNQRARPAGEKLISLFCPDFILLKMNLFLCINIITNICYSLLFFPAKLVTSAKTNCNCLVFFIISKFVM